MSRLRKIMYEFGRAANLVHLIVSTTTELIGWAGDTTKWVFYTPGEVTASRNSDGSYSSPPIVKSEMTVVDHTYRVTFTIVSATGSGAIIILIGGNSYGGYISALGTHTVTGTVTAGGLSDRLYLWPEFYGVPGSITIKDVSIEDIT